VRISRPVDLEGVGTKSVYVSHAIRTWEFLHSHRFWQPCRARCVYEAANGFYAYVLSTRFWDRRGIGKRGNERRVVVLYLHAKILELRPTWLDVVLHVRVGDQVL